MCYDLNEYDPFEPLIIRYGGDEEYTDSEPMNSYNWEEWLSEIEEQEMNPKCNECDKLSYRMWHKEWLCKDHWAKRAACEPMDESGEGAGFGVVRDE